MRIAQRGPPCEEDPALPVLFTPTNEKAGQSPAFSHFRIAQRFESA
jgi:hypothetical protein